MKYLFILFTIVSLASCKQCIECKYATLKGTEMEKFCSSTKQDRIDFEARMDSLARAAGSTAICDKTGF
jgi:uncharacterized membrane protein YjdF